MAINFFEEEIKSSLSKKRITKQWLRSVAKNKGYTIKDLNYVFCSDEYLLDINIQYLNHEKKEMRKEEDAALSLFQQTTVPRGTVK